MSTREAREVYRVHSLDVNELNRLLSRMADRLDELEGRRGTPEFFADLNLGGYRARNAGAPVVNTDVTRLEETKDLSEEVAIQGRNFMSTQYKGLIGEEDLQVWGGSGDAETFTRTTSSGATLTLNKVGAATAGWHFKKIDADEIEAADIIAKGPWIDVRAYGADPDAVDNLAALDAAVAACPVGGMLYFPPVDGTYAVSASWTINKSISIWMGKNTWIGYSGTGTAVDFSATLYRQTVHMNVNNTGTVNWGTATQTGIKFNYCVYNQLYLQAIGFTLGVHWAPTTGNWCNGNTIYLGDLWSNKYAIRQEHGASAEQYVNRNIYLGGVISVADTLNPTVDRYGIHLAGSSTNVFNGYDISLPSPASASAYGVYIDGGSGNEFIGTIEGVDKVLKIAGETTGNVVRGTVQTASGPVLMSDAVDDASTTAPGTNAVQWNVNPIPSEGLTAVFSVQDIHRRALANNRSGSNMYYSIPGFTACVASGGAHALFEYDSAADALMFQCDTYLRVSSTRAVGRLVNTEVVKDFWLNISKVGTWAPTLVVKAFDAALTLKTGGTDIVGFSASPYASYALTWTADSYAGSYLCAMQETAHIHAGAATKWIWVGISGDGSDDGGLTGISLKCGANQAAPWSGAGYDLVTLGGYDDHNQHDLSCDVAPIGGLLNNGTRIWHNNAATGEPLGWVVTGRTTTVANGGEPAGETSIAVDSITGVAASDIVGLAITKGMDTKWFWTSANGAPGAGAITVAHAIPTGWALADDAQVITWRLLALANLP